MLVVSSIVSGNLGMFRSSVIVSCVLILFGCGQNSSKPGAGISSIPSPAGSNSQLPYLATTVDGLPVMSWVETVAGTSSLKVSRLTSAGAEVRWTLPTTVSSGTDWFVNWADFPSVVPIAGDLWAAHWLRNQSDATFAYDVVISLSTDGGQTWKPGMVPHQDGSATEHGFVSLFPLLDGVGAVWLDGRQMLGGGSHAQSEGPDSETAASENTPAEIRGMTLRAIQLVSGEDNDRGRPEDGEVLDQLTCDCCQTDAATAGNGVVVVYRDRTPAEIRDIYLIRNEFNSWSVPIRVAEDDWHIAGCPVNGPAVAAEGDTVVVAWYTEAQQLPRVRLAVSEDGGRHFGIPLDISDTKPLGRVDVVLLEDGSSVVSWLENLEKGSQGAGLFIRSVSPLGVMGQTRLVAETGNSRPSGFPQMVRLGRKSLEQDNSERLSDLLLAWTDLETDRVKTARARVSGY